MTRKTSTRYPPEVRARAVRMVQEHRGYYPSEWAALSSIAAKIGCTAETLRGWVRQVERDRGLKGGTTSEERERLKALERENRELRRVNEILRKGEPAKVPPVQARWRTRILPRRSSTAGPSHDRLYRRSPGRLRGRGHQVFNSFHSLMFAISRCGHEKSFTCFCKLRVQMAAPGQSRRHGQ